MEDFCVVDWPVYFFVFFTTAAAQNMQINIGNSRLGRIYVSIQMWAIECRLSVGNNGSVSDGQMEL